MSQDPGKYENKTARSKPSQKRSRERVRVILLAALQLYKERGVVNVTTNDIAKRAGIPIGSLYRYYSNKDAITSALVELYMEGMETVFEDVCRHPMLKKLSWGEIVALLVGGWVDYLRLNGPLNFLYITRVNPEPYGPILVLWDRLYESFGDVLHARCSRLTRHQIVVAFSLTYTAAEMGADHGYRQDGFEELYQEAMVAATIYLENACERAGKG